MGFSFTEEDTDCKNQKNKDPTLTLTVNQQNLKEI